MLTVSGIYLPQVNGWELERILERALDALRCPPPDTKVGVLSGGERRRVGKLPVV